MKLFYTRREVDEAIQAEIEKREKEKVGRERYECLLKRYADLEARVFNLEMDKRYKEQNCVCQTKGVTDVQP